MCSTKRIPVHVTLNGAAPPRNSAVPSRKAKPLRNITSCCAVLGKIFNQGMTVGTATFRSSRSRPNAVRGPRISRHKIGPPALYSPSRPVPTRPNKAANALPDRVGSQRKVLWSGGTPESFSQGTVGRFSSAKRLRRTRQATSVSQRMC